MLKLHFPTFKAKFSHLILVQLAVFEGRLSLWLEGDDDETHEDVDHEECDDDDVDEVEDGDVWTVIVNWPHIRGFRVYRDVENAANK